MALSPPTSTLNWPGPNASHIPSDAKTKLYRSVCPEFPGRFSFVCSLLSPQVHLQRRAFVVNRTFRFYQSEGEILKRYGAPTVEGACLIVGDVNSGALLSRRAIG